MKNAELLKLHPSLPAKQRELKAAERAIAKATADVYRLTEELRHLEKVSKVRDGIALEVRGGGRNEGVWIEALGEDIKRCAAIYAHNDGAAFGLHTYTDAFGRQGEQWHGADLTRAEAERQAYEWVLRGVRPPR